MNFAALWSLDPSVIYLNHGSFGACPTAVLEVQAALRREMEREPVDFLVAALPSRLDAARRALAAFLEADPADLVFVPNATAGVVAAQMPLYVACLLGVAARVCTLEPRLALAGIIISLTGWPLFRLGQRLFGGRPDSQERRE